MARPINLFTAVRGCSRDNWGSAGKWLAYTVGAGFLPLIIGVLVVYVLSTHPVNWADFLIHGEFAIYSATLIAGSARLISREYESAPFVHREMFILTAILTLAVSVTVYVLIKAAAFFSQQSVVNQGFVERFSLPLLIFSIVFAFLVFLLDHQRFHPNVRGIAKQKERDLAEQFEAISHDLPQARVEVPEADDYAASEGNNDAE